MDILIKKELEKIYEGISLIEENLILGEENINNLWINFYNYLLELGIKNKLDFSNKGDCLDIIYYINKYC